VLAPGEPGQQSVQTPAVPVQQIEYDVLAILQRFSCKRRRGFNDPPSLTEMTEYRVAHPDVGTKSLGSSKF
jgi:hypothetical protein